MKNLKRVNPVSCRIKLLLISRSNLQASERGSCCKRVFVEFFFSNNVFLVFSLVPWVSVITLLPTSDPMWKISATAGGMKSDRPTALILHNYSQMTFLKLIKIGQDLTN